MSDFEHAMPSIPGWVLRRAARLDKRFAKFDEEINRGLAELTKKIRESSNPLGLIKDIQRLNAAPKPDASGPASSQP